MFEKRLLILLPYYLMRYEQGMEQGLERGIELTLKSISDKLREQGVEDAIIEETVAAARHA